MKKYFIIAIWLICSYVNWGLTMGYFSHRFPDQDQVAISVFTSIMGPMGTPVVLLIGHPYHWQIKPYDAETRWEYFHQSAPDIDREWFERHYN